MATHTKWPWVLDGIGSDGSWEVWTNHDDTHGSVICGRSAWGHRAAESRANGRLIAAAPNLLEALSAGADGPKDGESWAEWFAAWSAKARSALAKALPQEGKTK